MFKDRKILIFETMEQILSEDGYESLTYANISSRCHLHTTTITYYFNDKEDMLIQFFEYLVIKGNRELPVFYSSIPSDTPPVESFCHLTDHIPGGGILKSIARTGCFFRSDAGVCRVFL